MDLNDYLKEAKELTTIYDIFICRFRLSKCKFLSNIKTNYIRFNWCPV